MTRGTWKDVKLAFVLSVTVWYVTMLVPFTWGTGRVFARVFTRGDVEEEKLYESHVCPTRWFSVDNDEDGVTVRCVPQIRNQIQSLIPSEADHRAVPTVVKVLL